MSSVPTSEATSTPWKTIYVEPNANIRSDMPKRKEMAASLKDNGQLQPVVVAKGGPEGYLYTLVAGNRRMLGFEDNGWTSKDVLIVVREYKKGHASLARIADNWIENSEREDVSPFDLAERVHQLVSGTYPAVQGEKAEPQPKAAIQELLGISTSQLNNLLRVYRDVDPDVASKARKAGVPLRVLIAWAGVEGKGKDADAVAEDKANKQMAMFEEWKQTQEALAEAGRKRAPKSAKGGKGKATEAEPSSGIISRERKIDSGYTTKSKDGEAKPRKFTPDDYLTVVRSKQSETKAGEEKARLQGIIDAFRFFTGEVSKLPGLTAADFKVLEEEAEEEEDEAAA